MNYLTFIAFLLLYLPASAVVAQEKRIRVTKLKPDVYVHTSFNMYGSTLVPSNGLILNTTDGAVLIDMAWGEAQTEQLLEWITENLRKPVKMCIVTHAHDDRVGALALLQRKNIVTFGAPQTAELTSEQGFGTLASGLPLNQTLTVGNQELEVYYPGPGHTSDNVVVWLPRQKVLFGGCLVKDPEAKNLGNIADADLTSWPGAIQNIQERYSHIKLVVPGHGMWGNDKALLDHTLKLLRKQQPYYTTKGSASDVLPFFSFS